MYKYRDLYPNMGSINTGEFTLPEPTELSSISNERDQQPIVTPADYTPIIMAFIGLLVILGLGHIL